MAYAVVDFETTGIFPGMNYRVLEIGVTHIEADGVVSGRWETLVNPERDLGPQHVHGVKAADVIDAPIFADIVGDFVGLLSGRTFVAHNATFDIRFLVAEFARVGLPLGNSVPHICTMALASTFAVPGRSTLAHCYAHFGIDLVDAHSAGADSFATAQLLSAYKQSSRHVQEWVRYWTEVSQLGRNFPYPHASPSGALWKPRGSTQGSNNHFLDRIADNPVEVSAEGDEVLYLDVLDKCLLDGHLTAAEQTQLVELASSMGLNRERVFELNRQYFEAIKARFWQDGTLDDTETAQLHNIAAALGLGPDVITLNRTDTKPGSIAWSAPEFALKSGDHVVLTGQMRNERPIWEKRLTAAGLIPHPRVTKKTKILVAADPNSASTKARLARTYSIPIVDEEWFERFLGLRQ